jgi:hypothetical protein
MPSIISAKINFQPIGFPSVARTVEILHFAQDDSRAELRKLPMNVRVRETGGEPIVSKE